MPPGAFLVDVEAVVDIGVTFVVTGVAAVSFGIERTLTRQNSPFSMNALLRTLMDTLAHAAFIEFDAVRANPIER